eukprot:2702194-Pyramimonas_sp.AAC.1
MQRAEEGPCVPRCNWKSSSRRTGAAAAQQARNAPSRIAETYRLDEREKRDATEMGPQQLCEEQGGDLELEGQDE